MRRLPEPFAQGRTAEVYPYGESAVLKLFRPGIPVPLIEDEFRVGRRAREAGIATPLPLERLEIDGRQGIVFERIAGESMLAAMLARPERADGLVRQMADLHAAVHELDAPPGLPSQRGTLQARIREAQRLTEAEKEAALRRLDALPDAAKLCHGDFHPDNIMVADGAWIIDWMNGASGHPACDAARTMLLLRYGALPPGTPRELVSTVDALRQGLVRGYVTRYLERTGIQLREVESWILPLAAARLTERPPEAEQQTFVRLVKTQIGAE
ncbi:Phosphotransferase enzyme family protein [Paenibacillus sp. UNC496MF]|uniref:phosphotransferase family protein n=1 Tax=Paenibacillus sp. UNC496MF TaxID=1502753 RepID=UPI0008E2F31D|nr:aminoglycoside phosphotransferase family protein [Paenibacillus sp. UNC496MF]SFI50851.1 Phosphotransferase enzyme family protein [Paenibacillus sp. UNC496MF]